MDYYFLGYCAITFLTCLFAVYVYFDNIMIDFCITKKPIKVSLSELLKSVLLGLIWPVTYLLIVYYAISDLFTSRWLSAKLEALARRKYPEDFI